MAKEQFTTPRLISSSTSDRSTTQDRAKYATERAQLMFGCYRRGDANDPDTYVVAIAGVLADYDFEIIRKVTDPRYGLPRRLQFMPTVAEVADECAAEAERAHRIAELGQYRLTQRSYTRPSKEPASLATILYRPDAPHYQRMVDRAMSGKEDPRKWKWDDDGRSIWVAYSWVDGPAPSKRFVAPTDEQLLAKYGPIKKAEPSPTAETEDIPFE